MNEKIWCKLCCSDWKTCDCIGEEGFEKRLSWQDKKGWIENLVVEALDTCPDCASVVMGGLVQGEKGVKALQAILRNSDFSLSELEDILNEWRICKRRVALMALQERKAKMETNSEEPRVSKELLRAYDTLMKEA